MIFSNNVVFTLVIYLTMSCLHIGLFNNVVITLVIYLTVLYLCYIKLLLSKVIAVSRYISCFLRTAIESKKKLVILK